MRISSQTIYDNMTANVAASSERYFKIQQTLSTGKQLNQPSDSPEGAWRSLTLRSTLDTFTQYQQNINQAKGFAGSTDSALTNAADLLRKARTLALQGANDSLNQEARPGLAAQIDALESSLAQVANQTYGSRFIFSGQRTTTPAFTKTAAGYAYQGGTAATGDDQLNVEITTGEVMQVNVTGDVAFQSAFDTLETLKNHIAGGQTSLISNSDLAALDGVMQTVTSLQADFGARVQRLDQTRDHMDQASLTLTDMLSKVEDADLPTVITQMQTAQTAYQAALTATARGFQQSLLDFLK